MDPGVRRDDDLRVCSQPSLPLFQPTGKDRKPVRPPLCHPDESQDPASFVVLKRYKGTLQRDTHFVYTARQVQSVNPSFARGTRRWIPACAGMTI